MLGALRKPSPLLIAGAAGLVALAFGCYQLSQPNVLTGVLDVLGYDDGVYSGISIRLVHGSMPYRDFVYVHPPGLALLLAPTALLGMATSTHVAVVADRLLTVLATASNPFLAGLLVRRLGRAAVGVTSFSLALWPIVVGSDRGTSLEPFLVLLVLIASLVLFAGSSPGLVPTRRRLLIGGVILGAACSVKLWGFLAAVPAIGVAFAVWRLKARWVLIGAAATLLVVCLPFFVAAPHEFWHDVVVDQLGRQKAPTTPLGLRLRLIAGLASIDAPAAISAPAWLVEAGFVALAAGTIWVFAFVPRRSTLEWYIAVAAVFTFAGMLVSPVNTDFYAYFPACMLAPLGGVVAARVWAVLRTSRAVERAGRGGRAGLAIVASLGTLALGLWLGAGQASFDATYLAGAWDPTAIDQYIPAGACVLSTFPPVLTVSNRFVSKRPGCPAVLDPFGMYLAEDDGSLPHPSPPYPVTFSYQWFGYLQDADYLIVPVPYSDFIPWADFTIGWFKQNYALVTVLNDPSPSPLGNDSAGAFFIYRHVG